MSEPASASGRVQATAVSLQTNPAWLAHVVVPPDQAQVVSSQIIASFKSLIDRAQTGGSNNQLRVAFTFRKRSSAGAVRLSSALPVQHDQEEAHKEATCVHIGIAFI